MTADMVIAEKEAAKRAKEAAKVATAWKTLLGGEGVRRQLWARELADALKVSEREVYEINARLGGQYRLGWEEDTVSGSRICAGEQLWKIIKN